MSRAAERNIAAASMLIVATRIAWAQDLHRPLAAAREHVGRPAWRPAGRRRPAQEEHQGDDPALGEQLQVGVVDEVRLVDDVADVLDAPGRLHVVALWTRKLLSPTPATGLSLPISQATYQRSERPLSSSKSVTRSQVAGALSEGEGGDADEHGRDREHRCARRSPEDDERPARGHPGREQAAARGGADRPATRITIAAARARRSDRRARRRQQPAGQHHRGDDARGEEVRVAGPALHARRAVDGAGEAAVDHAERRPRARRRRRRRSATRRSRLGGRRPWCDTTKRSDQRGPAPEVVAAPAPGRRPRPARA